MLRQKLTDASKLIHEAIGAVDSISGIIGINPHYLQPQLPPYNPPLNPPVSVPQIPVQDAPYQPPAPPKPQDPEPINEVPKPELKPSGVLFKNIIATCWLNKEDYNSGSAKSLAYTWAPKLNANSGKTLRGASLPGKVEPGTTVDVVYKGRSSLRVPVIDVGPWRTNDQFWLKGTRPVAESLNGQRVNWDGQNWVPANPGRLKCNGAGIDLTPAVWAELLGLSVERVWSESPSAQVDITVNVPSAAPGTAAKNSYLERARKALSFDCTYSLGKELPGPYSDCSGFTDWVWGFSRGATGLNTDAIIRDARSSGGRFDLVTGTPMVGDGIVFGAGNGRRHGHVGIISEVINGRVTKVIHCSSAHAAPRAIRETGPEVFTRNGAIIVRYRG